jgi:hypothetical protein
MACARENFTLTFTFTFYKNILILTNFNHFIIPLLGIIFYVWILYTLDVKERPLPNSSFYAIVNQLLDDGQQTGRNVS